MSPVTSILRLGRSLGFAAALLAAGAMEVSAFGGNYAGRDQVVPGKSDQALPDALIDVGIDEHLGATLPLDATFKDDAGKEVKLSDYFGKKPVLMNFAYYRCPMLCNMVLSGMVDGMKKMTWTPGNEFEVVTIGIDPREGPDLAKAKKETHIEALKKPQAAAGWHFLTGDAASIKKVSDAVGFKFTYNKATDEYAHQAGIFTISPQGKISRYLYGIEYSPKDLRLALLDASEGKALSLGDKLVMFCYRYDASAKGYVLFARNFMKGGGYVIVAALFLLMGSLWRKEFKRNKNKAVEPVASPVGPTGTTGSRA